MEPWMEEEQRQARWHSRLSRLPRCACCDEPIATERYLNLNAFGIAAAACETCVEQNFGAWEALEEGMFI